MLIGNKLNSVVSFMLRVLLRLSENGWKRRMLFFLHVAFRLIVEKLTPDAQRFSQEPITAKESDRSI